MFISVYNEDIFPNFVIPSFLLCVYEEIGEFAHLPSCSIQPTQLFI